MYISEADIHAVAGTLKQYFRELPDPLFTANLYTQFTDALGRMVVFLYCKERVFRNLTFLVVDRSCFSRNDR